MITISNNVGRLIELRQTGHIALEELQATVPAFQEILASREGTFVMGTDWRGMRLLSQEVSDALLAVIRADQDRVERQVVVIDPMSIVGLQVRRLFKEMEGDTKAVVDSVEEAEAWLAEALSEEERARFRAFMARR